MTYKFALDAGTYEVVTGFYDPWAQWAGDDRHAKITVADEAGTELAVHEDHKISGSKDSVTLENITLSEAGNVTVNLSPLKKVDSNIDSCDVLVSFIVIVKKAAEQPDIPKTDTKAGLKAAIDLAKTLKAFSTVRCTRYRPQPSYSSSVSVISAAGMVMPFQFS